MGLDCFMQRSRKSPKEISFPSDLNLCGGMFSGHGSTGSFRGKVYDSFFSATVGVSLYDNMTPEEVADVAEKLDSVFREHLAQAWDDEVGWYSEKREERYSTVSAQEVRDLAVLFRAAAEQHCKMIASY